MSVSTNKLSHCFAQRACGRGEVAQHGISVTHPRGSNVIGVELFEEKFHGTSRLHQARTDLGGFETNLWDSNIDCLLQLLSDLGDPDDR